MILKKNLMSNEHAIMHLHFFGITLNSALFHLNEMIKNNSCIMQTGV